MGCLNIFVIVCVLKSSRRIFIIISIYRIFSQLHYLPLLHPLISLKPRIIIICLTELCICRRGHHCRAWWGPGSRPLSDWHDGAGRAGRRGRRTTAVDGAGHRPRRAAAAPAAPLSRSLPVQTHRLPHGSSRSRWESLQSPFYVHPMVVLSKKVLFFYSKVIVDPLFFFRKISKIMCTKSYGPLYNKLKYLL